MNLRWFVRRAAPVDAPRLPDGVDADDVVLQAFEANTRELETLEGGRAVRCHRWREVPRLVEEAVTFS